MEIPKNKLILSGVLIGFLAIIITTFSVYHARHMGHFAFQYQAFIYGASLLSVAVGGIIVYLFEEKINKSQLNRLLKILPEDERKVLGILIERGEIEQRRLGTLAGISTVKTSRIIAILERRKLVDKKKQGYTNLIILKL